MKVLFVASECVPFFKSGGLADVVGSLPKALADLGMEVRVVLPKYQTLSPEYQEKLSDIDKLNVRLGWRNQYCGLEKLELGGIHYYFIDNEYYFKRDSLYGYYDEAERYIYFSKAVLKALPYMGYRPDIIHVHDWQTAIIPLLLKARHKEEFFYSGIKTVLTIHNLKYQGIFPKELMTDMLNLGWEYFHQDCLESNGAINLLKGGLASADALTTVSPSYASEIQTPFYGEGLNGLLRALENKLRGIINGIDYNEWNPETDGHIFKNYNKNTVEYKKVNKAGLQGKLGLKTDPRTPLLGIVSRLVSQKGFDLIAEIIEELLQKEIQLAILGTGDKKYEELFQSLSDRFPDKVASCIKFDDTLARQIYAGADFILMPSLFEPCGLTQLIALRYGTIPIVRRTGGLKDTVCVFNAQTLHGNGFGFINYGAKEMLNAIESALMIYDKESVWADLQTNAMSPDNSWALSASKYHDLYQELIE